MYRYLIGLIVATVLSGAATATDPADPALKGLHDRWVQAMKELRIPGMAVVAVRGDEVVLLDALGLRDPDGAKPVTAPFNPRVSSASDTAQLSSARSLAINCTSTLFGPVGAACASSI